MGPVVDGRLAVRLAGHEHEARPGLGVAHGQAIARTEERDLGSTGAPAVRTDGRLSLETALDKVTLDCTFG